VTSWLPAFVPAIRQTAAILSLRLLPFALYAVVCARRTAAHKFAWACTYATTVAVACWLGALPTIAAIVCAAVYYFVVGVGVSRLGRWIATGELTRGGMFAIAFFVFLVLPGVLLPGRGMVVFLVVGWDLTLSSYSYNVETAVRGAARPPLGEALFFLFVNPTLVYTARGKRVSDGGGLAGLGRAAGGAVLILANIALTGALVEFLRQSTAATSRGGTVLLTIALGATRFLELYAAHSSLASLQIGLMRHVGWRVPERYRYPIAATSPMDFWRRWNTYVRVWLEAYLFLPLARRIARRTRRRVGAVAAAGATLVASGLLHMAFVFAGSQSLAGASLSLFVVAAAVLCVWSAASAGGQAIRTRLAPRQAERFDGVARVVGWASVTGALVGAAVVWG
jgi:hypothetical protein